MLILTRKPGESLYIGDHIKVIIVEIKGNQIRVGIEAPSDLRIYREEIYLQILEENKQAAKAAIETPTDLEGLSEAWQGKSFAVPEARGGMGKLGGLAAQPKDPTVVMKRKKAKKLDE